jgi:hypothetical protein
MRLSGAFEVPIFIQIQSAGGVTNGPQPSIRTAQAGGPNGVEVQGGHVSPSLAAFWQQSPYKNASPVLTPLWRALAADGMAGHRLIYEARGGSTQDLACAIYLSEPLYLEGALGDGITKFVPDDAYRWVFNKSPVSPRAHQFKVDGNGVPAGCSKDLTKSVGFLFLVMENSSQDLLTDFKLEYKEFAPNELPPAFMEQVEASRIAYPEEVERTAALQPFYRVLRNQKTTSTFGPNLRPGGQLIWLFAIYATRPDQFESRYLRPWQLPVRITYQVNGSSHSEAVRFPRRRNTSPIAMPFGWYEQ